MIFLIIFLFVSDFILVSIKNNKMTDRIDQLAFSSFRFLFCCLAVFSGVVPLWASDGPDDDMKETEEEACLGLLLCITIVGIPFGLQFFKIAKLSLMPFGAEIVG